MQQEYNVIEAWISSRTRQCIIGPLWQYDRGQILKIVGVTLPENYEVHFSNDPRGESETVIGNADGVQIPNKYLISGANVFAWLYINQGDSGSTECQIEIRVRSRAKPTSYVPDTEEEAEILDKLIASKVDAYLAENPPADGEDGATPYVGDNGNWFIDGEDTGVPARGEEGPQGPDGKSAYAYAQDGGYTGTEAEFAEKLAAGSLLVTFTEGDEMDGGIFAMTADKTVSECIKAYKNGTPVYGTLDPTGMGYSGHLNVFLAEYNQVVFALDAQMSGSYAVVMGTITGSDESWMAIKQSYALKTDIPTVLKNPNALIINGIPYDGADVVDMTDTVKALIRKHPADWNAAEGEPGHVLNRTHWSEFTESEWLPKTVCEFTEEAEGIVMIGEKTITPGKTYKVTWNGVEYTCVAEDLTDTIGSTVFGNMSYFNDLLTGYTEPFAAAVMDGQALLLTFEGLPLSATVSIKEIDETVYKMPDKYIDKDFRITVKLNADLTTYTVDKTYGEILTAYNKGKNITLFYKGITVCYMYYLTLVENDRLVFGNITIDDSTFTLRCAAIDSGNVFSIIGPKPLGNNS